MDTRHYLKPVVASALAATLSLGTVTPAFAVSASLEAQVNEAQTRLSELYGEAEQRNYELEQTVGELNKTIKKLDETSDAIVQTEADLAVARQHLGEVISEDYKAGHIDLLTLLFGANDFEDLVSRFVYANKVATYHADVVAEVNVLSNELKEQKDTYAEAAEQQKELVSEQKRLKEETDQAVSEAQTYYDQLSEELRAQIAAEQEAAAKAAQEAAAAAAAEAERLAAQEAEEAPEQVVEDTEAPAETTTTTTTTKKKTKKQTTTTTTTTDETTTTTTEPSSGSKKATTGNEAPASVTPGATYSAAAMVSQAYQAIGSAYRYSGYVWTGNPATSAFTCSGLVDFALGRPSNSSWPTSLYAEVQGAGGIKKSISKLSYGDLVFTGTGGIGHVGIYVGDGCFLDSSWDGVGVRSINPSTFIGGGSIF